MIDQNNYRNWRVDDPRFNEKEAWPSSMFPEADYHYFRDCGNIICAVAMMLRHNHIEEEVDEDKFNPFILNERLIKCHAFFPNADLNLFHINRLYPIEYYDKVPYEREILEGLVRIGSYCIIAAESDDGREACLVLDSLTREDVKVIDTRRGDRLLSEYKAVHYIRYFRDKIEWVEDPDDVPEKLAPDLGKPTLLVNVDYHLPRGYKPDDLIWLNSMEDSRFILSQPDIQLDRTAAEAFNRLCHQAQRDGIGSIVVSSGYRDHELQKKIYKEQYGVYVAMPGHSEHETGLAVDIRSTDLEYNTVVHQYFAEHCYKYGFILRYPLNKIHYTMIPSEPWHFRYVGEEAAGFMHDHDWCLEEYHIYKDDL